MKMQYCEVCGTMGVPGETAITKTMIEGKDYSDEYYLCDTCYEEWDMFTLEGNNREELLESMHECTMTLNGPQSCFISNNRDWDLLNVCDMCHRKHSGGYGFGLEINLPADMRKVLPGKLKKSKHVFLCTDCQSEIFTKMVERIKKEDLPLFINYEGFKTDEDWPNSEITERIEKRFKGIPLRKEPTIEKPEEYKCLSISIEFLSKKDFILLSKRGEKEEGKTNANPFDVSRYEHGFLLFFNWETYESVLEYFGYSKTLISIFIKAKELGYNYLRFDSRGPKYKEFEK